MSMLAALNLVILNFAISGWWWGTTLEEASKQDVISIAQAMGYTATDVNTSESRVKVNAPGLEFVTYLEDCRVKSGVYLEQCSKIKLQACWYLSEFGFGSTRNVAEFSNEYNRSVSPVRKFDMAYAFIVSGGRVVCLRNGFYLNDGVSSQYIGANMRTFVRAAEEFKVFAHNWR